MAPQGLGKHDMTRTITAAGIASMAYDAASGLLGYTTEAGFFRLVDIRTGERMESYNLGSALGGFAFADDGSAFIANVEFATYYSDVERDGLIHHLDRGGPSVANITFDMDFGNSAATDVAIASNGLGLVTTTDQWTLMHVLDTNTGTISQLQTDGYVSFYSPRVTLSDEGRYVLIQEVGSSGGTVHLWDSQVNQIVADTDNFEIGDAGFRETGYGDEDGAVSETAGLIVFGDLQVFDMNLAPVIDLSGIAGRPADDYYGYHGWDAFAFGEEGSTLYAIDGERDLLIAIDTATFDLADAFSFAVPDHPDGFGDTAVSDMLLVGDTIVVQAIDSVIVGALDTLFAPLATGTSEADALVGSRRNDMLSGFEGDDALIGADGDDLLDGGLGADDLSGERGADTLRGGAGDDTLRGGAGDDVFAYGAGDTGRDDILDFASGDVIDLSLLPGFADRSDVDILRVGDAMTLSFGDDMSVRLVGFTGQASDIAFVFSTYANRVQGTFRGETLTGTEADDYMDGHDGNDVLMGMDGSDMILGGAGNDVLYGDGMTS